MVYPIFHIFSKNILIGGFKHVLFSISYMGCHPKPIDELHHFSRWFGGTTNQDSADYDGDILRISKNDNQHYPIIMLMIIKC